MTMIADGRIVFVTVPTRETGLAIAQALVHEHLAACVNIIGPIESVYRWDAAVQHDSEFLLVIKTTAERYAGLEARIIALHPYQTPEVIAVSIAAGSAPYLEWIRSATTR